MKPTLVTETSEVKTQTLGKFPEESTLESQRGESLKTYIIIYHITDCKGPDDGSELKHVATNRLIKLLLCATVLMRVFVTL
jgi:hypothetical protein